MELLEAVNTALPYLGAHTITRVEGARHPTVDAIIAAIKRQRITLLTEGWYFNKRKVRLPVNTDGRIDVPLNTLNVRGIDCDVVMDGEKFFNMDTGSRYFDKPITIWLMYDWEFNRLNQYAANVVLYNAILEVYLQDYGRESVIQELQAMVDKNIVSLEKEHLRWKQFNVNKNPASNRNRKWQLR